MCWTEKICFYVPLNIGCVLLGAINIVFATAMIIVSTIHFANGNGDVRNSLEHHLPAVFQLELKHVSLNIVFGVVLTVALFWILFSLMLIMGIIRNNSSLILAYFFYGILLVIFSNLSGLLVVINSCHSCLALGLIMFFFSLLYIHFLVAVYTVYELMQRGTDFRFHKYNNDDACLLTEEDL